MSGAGSDGVDAGGRPAAVALGELVRVAVRHRDLLDVLTLLCERAVDVLPAAGAGLLVRDGDGRLRTVAASGADPDLLDRLEAHATVRPDDGPADRAAERRTSVVGGGPGRAHTFPVAVDGTVMGRFDVFAAVLDPADVPVAEAFADLAALALLRPEDGVDGPTLARRVHMALEGRAVVAQAVGVVAQRFALDPDGALRRLRAAARTERAGLVALAEAVVTGARPLPATLRRPGDARDDGSR